MPVATTAAIDPGILIAIITTIQGVAVAIIGGLFHADSKRRKKKDDDTEKRANLRAEESRLAMQMMSANSSLAIATGLALQEGKTNGKMSAALKQAEAAQREYYSFINRVASTQMTAE